MYSADMPVIIPPGYAQITYVWTSPNFDSGGGTSTFGVARVEGESLEATAQRWANSWDDTLGGIADSDYSLSLVSAVDETESAEVVGPGPNGNVVTSAPPNVAVLLSLISARRGPRGRGRLYLPGLAAESLINEAGILDATYRDELQGLAAIWSGGGTIGARRLVVLQGSEGISPPISPPPDVGTPIVGAKVATQRRRLRR